MQSDKQPKTEEINRIYPGRITWNLGTDPCVDNTYKLIMTPL